MIAILLLLLALAVGVGAVVMAHADAGYVLIGYEHWTVETTLVVLVLAVILGALLVYGLARLAANLLYLPGRLRGAVARRRAERAGRSFESGLMHLLQGDWKNAELDLLRHAADRRSPQLNYLAAARAAQHLGASDRRDHYLELGAAHASDRELQVAMLTTRAELQRERSEHGAVAATARELHALDANNLYAIELLANALAEQHEWAELDSLLAEPEAENLDPAWRTGLRRRALLACMRNAVGDGDLGELKRRWSAADAPLKQTAERLAYACGLSRLGDDSGADALATQTLNSDWDSGMATLYARSPAVDPMTQLAAAENWLKRYGERPELLAMAGRACLKHRLWGKAGSYFEALLRVAPTPETYADLARLAEQTQRPEDAARYYREGLALAAAPAVSPKALEHDETETGKNTPVLTG